MSDEGAAEVFARHLNRAIETALGELGGGFPQGFSGTIDYIDSDGGRRWATVHAEDQKPATSLGLLRFATLIVERQIINNFDRNEQGD